MSVQNAVAFLHQLAEDSELSARAGSKEDAVRLAAERGLPFSLEELDEASASIADELSDEELKSLAAGRIFWW